MENMYFKCPLCNKTLHTCNDKNRFPINYKIRCKNCNSVFGFIPKLFVRGYFIETDAEEDEIADMLNFEDEDKE